MIRELVDAVAHKLAETHNLAECKVSHGEDPDTFKIDCKDQAGNKVCFTIKPNGEVLCHHAEHKAQQGNQPKQLSYGVRDYLSNKEGSEYINKSMFRGENPLSAMTSFQHTLKATLQAQNQRENALNSPERLNHQEMRDLVGKSQKLPDPRDVGIPWTNLNVTQHERTVASHIKKSMVNY